MNLHIYAEPAAPARGKFEHPDVTAKGEQRATVRLHTLETLWFNTGTLCNIECVNCYIESSPKNDRLVYLTTDDVVRFLDEISADNHGTREIGFTGGEPFLNPDMLDILEQTLVRGFETLVLTNAMQPMQRPKIKDGLLALKERFGDQMTLRISLDHHGQELHDKERGPGAWKKALAGIDWLNDAGFKIALAGRTCWDEDEASERAGYNALVSDHGWNIDPENDRELVLFPEMEAASDAPEITTACWSILDKNPRDIMCASSRMVVKRKGAKQPTVLPCTLIAYDDKFDGGATLAEAFTKNGGMYKNGAVKLCHVNCATFCVLGGGSCS